MRIQPSPHTLATVKRTPFVLHRFELAPDVREAVRRLTPRFGFDGFGEATYFRTYSRPMPDGGQEQWADTVLRVIDGVFSIRKDWYIRHGLAWDEGRWQDTAGGMALAMFEMNWLPPGRGLFAMGTDYVYERGSMALYNCAYAEVGVGSFPKDFGWIMDALMCVTAETWVLTSLGPRQVKDLIDRPFVAMVGGEPYFSKTGFFQTGEREVIEVEAQGYTLRATSNHPVMTERGWVEVGKLKEGDELHLGNLDGLKSWDGTGTEDEGFILGHLIGDGHVSVRGAAAFESYEPDEEAKVTRQLLAGAVLSLPGRADRAGWYWSAGKGCWRMADQQAGALAARYGIRRGHKTITPEMEKASSAFCIGLIRGCFDTDGCALATSHDRRVVLKWVDRSALKAVQRMLLRLGIKSTIKHDVEEADIEIQGNPCHRKDQYSLYLTGVDRARFAKLIGFSNTKKQARALDQIREPYNTKRTVKVTSITPCSGTAPVFDVKVEGAHAFDANGLMAHNCGVGVGFEAVQKPYDLAWPQGERALYVVPDTREGWVESVELLLKSYRDSSNPVDFDYSEIRGYGAPLKGLGGVSAGSEPLRRLHEHIRETCARYLHHDFGATRWVADVANGIGACVVMGNIRRSAQIAIGSINDQEFLDLKNYEKHPERAAWGWLSNNSVRLEQDADFEKMPEIASLIRKNGEPGFFNLQSTQKFARFGREVPDKARGLNPCQTAWAPLLTPNGIRQLGDLGIGDVVWSGSEWTKITNKVCTGKKEVFAYRTRAGTFFGTENHRVIQHGKRVEAGEAEAIDISWLNPEEVRRSEIQSADVIDGMLLGDGTVHKASNNLVALIIGEDDQDYFKDEGIKSHLVEHRPGIKEGYWTVSGHSITAAELPLTYNREVPERFHYGTSEKVCGFLRGLYTANGSVVGKPNVTRVTLKASSFTVVEAVQEMLSSIGIRSYYTVNKAHPVQFANGLYECKESYDVNITKDKGLFAELIGFVQGYKNARLAESLSVKIRDHPGKTTYEIVTKESLGVEEVFDITVAAEAHTYWTGGLLVSNCGEITLESGEVCNLSECFPTRCATDLQLTNAFKFATLYSSTVTLLPTHQPATNQVVARNRRIGVSVSGVAEWLDLIGAARMTKILRAGYKTVKLFNEELATEAGIPASIRVSTVKPSGSISLLAGVSPGLHFPTFKHAIRRMRVAKGSAIALALDRAGYPNEPDKAEVHNTLVFEFPIDQGHARKATDVPVWEQAAHLATMQREWSDNAVSVTLYFDPATEGDQLEQLLAQIAPTVKSVSALPHTPEGVYEQAPYSEITKEEYLRRKAAVKPIDWTKFRGDGQDEKYCSNDTCEVVRKPKVTS